MSASEFVNQLPPNLSDEMIPCYKRCRRHLQRVVEVGSAARGGIAAERVGCWNQCEKRNGEWFPKWGHRNGKLGGGSNRYGDYVYYGEPRRLRKPRIYPWSYGPGTNFETANDEEVGGIRYWKPSPIGESFLKSYWKELRNEDEEEPRRLFSHRRTYSGIPVGVNPCGKKKKCKLKYNIYPWVRV